MHENRIFTLPEIIIIYKKSAVTYMGTLTDAQLYSASYKQAQIKTDD